MSKNIQANSTTITNKANELKSLNSKFKEQVANLTSTENSLNSMWDGEANNAFHKAFTSDVAQMEKFYAAIEKYVTALNEIAKEYERAEKANTATANARKYK